MLKKSDKCLVQFIILLIFIFVCLIDFSSVWFVKVYNAPVFIIYSSLLLTFVIVSFGIREILRLKRKGNKDYEE